MDPKKSTPLTDPGKSKKNNPSQLEEMDSPHKIEETEQEANIVPESDEGGDKKSESETVSSSQRDEIIETLGIDDNDLETTEDEVVN